MSEEVIITSESEPQPSFTEPKDMAFNPKEWQIEWVDPNSLTPYEKNARKNDQTVPYLINAIKRFGFKVPIVIDKDGIVVCGHTRLKAALQIGYTKVPCIRADDLSDQEIKAFRLADNKIQELSGWDFPILEEQLAELKLDFDEDMVDFGFISGEGANIDDFFEDSSTSDGAEKKKKKIQCTCPECGHVFDKEV